MYVLVEFLCLHMCIPMHVFLYVPKNLCNHKPIETARHCKIFTEKTVTLLRMTVDDHHDN